jgi:hypothetical protein
VTRPGNHTSLKDQNRWHLWLLIAVNAAAFYAALNFSEFESAGFRALLNSATQLLPIGLATVVTTIANGLLSADMKARLVFLRWYHALPGNRAFSKYAQQDPRIDQVWLARMTEKESVRTPEAENATWYRLYKEVHTDPSVQQVHREFLLLRDYAGLAALFLIGFSAVALFTVQPPKVLAFYCVLLVAQFIIVRHAAATYGIRFVTTVLALKASAPAPRTPAARRPKSTGKAPTGAP